MAIPTLIHPARAELAEGPVWHEDALWWVDIISGNLNRLDPRTGLNTSRPTGDYLGAAIPTDEGRWLLVRRQSLALLTWSTGDISPFAQPERDDLSSRHRFNDAKCDPAGRLWAGTMSLDLKRDECGLFTLQLPSALGSTVSPQSPPIPASVPKPVLIRVLGGVSLANGLGWSPNGDTLYFADSLAKRIDAFPYDLSTGSLGARRTFATFSEGSPDGLTLDAEGHLWVALWGASCVVRLDGRTGRELTRHTLPVTQVSSCTFGGPSLRTLYITTAWEDFSRAQRETEPLAGSIFALETDTPGLPCSALLLP